MTSDAYKRGTARLVEIASMPATTLDELKAKLRACIVCETSEAGDTEQEHRIADTALLEFIGDAEVTRLFNELRKWYS